MQAVPGLNLHLYPHQVTPPPSIVQDLQFAASGIDAGLALDLCQISLLFLAPFH